MAHRDRRSSRRVSPAAPQAPPLQPKRLAQAIRLCLAAALVAGTLPDAALAACPDGSSTVTGTLAWGLGAGYTIDAGCTVASSGELDVMTLPTLLGRTNVSGTGLLTNYGKIVVLEGSSLSNSGRLLSQSGSKIYSSGVIANENYLFSRARLLNYAGAGLYNRGTFVLDAGGSVVDNTGALFKNYGTLRVAAGSSLDNKGRFFNYGTLDNAGSSFNGGEFNNTYVVVNHALFTTTNKLTNTGKFENAGTLINSLPTAVLYNNGSLLNENTLRNYGTVHTDFFIRNSASFENKPFATIINGAFYSGSVLLNVPNSEFLNEGVIENRGKLENGSLLANLHLDEFAASGSGVLLNFSRFDNGTTVLAPDFKSLLTYTGRFVNTGTFKNYGTTTNTAGSDFSNRPGSSVTNRGRIENAGSMTFEAGSSLDNAQGTIVNLAGGGIVAGEDLVLGAPVSGTLTLQAGSLFRNVAHLTNSSGHTQNNAGTLENEGSLSNFGTLNNTGTLTLAGGSFENTGGLLRNLSGGTLDSAVTLEFGSPGAGTIALNSGGTMVNRGTLGNRAGHVQVNVGKLVNEATFTNDGDFRNTGKLISYAPSSTATMTLTAGSVLSNYGSGYLSNGGTLTNRGTLNNFGLLTNVATGAAPPAALYNEGRLYNAPGGTLHSAGRFENRTGGLLDTLGNVTNGPAGSFTNFGTIDVRTDVASSQADASFVNLGTLTNKHRINVHAPTSHVSTFGNGGTFTNYGYLVNEGALENGTKLGTNEYHGMLTNYGTISCSAALANRAGSTLVNQGAIYNRPGGTISNTGTLTNAAYLRNDGGFDNFGTTTVTAGGALIGDGVFHQRDGVTRVDGALAQAAVLVSGGVLKGKGTITGPVTLSDTGVVAPGDSPGTLVIDGPFSMQGGTLEIQIEGTGAGQFDILQITGFASFTGGRIEFDFSNAHDIAPDASFAFITAPGGISGLDALPVSFLGLAPGFTFDFAAGGSTATISFGNLHLAPVSGGPLPGSVPVPPAIWLLGLPLAGVLRRRVSAAS